MIEFIKIDNFQERTLKQNILAIKERIDEIDERSKEKQDDIKCILKVLKVYKKRATNNELENGDYNETEYLFFIIEPILLIVTKNIQNLKLKCGEPYLKIAAADENAALYDEEHRAKGPKIDMIFRNTELNLDVAVLEMSGANQKTNQTHFIEDRSKIAKNLKIIMSYILNSVPFASVVEKKKLKIYGFHIYENKFYVYSLNKPDDLNFVFTKEKEFNIPTNCNKLNVDFSESVSNVWVIEKLLSTVHREIKPLLDRSAQRTMTDSSRSKNLINFHLW